MKFYLLFLISFLPCLLVTIFVLYPIITNKNQILKIGKHIVFVKKHRGLNEWHQMIYKHLKFPLNDNYGSHAIVLLAALYASKTGPILELGMGSTSSPLLHRLALEQKRIIYSADTDLRWINYYSNFTVNNTLHQLKYVEVKSEMGIEWAKSGIANFADWTVVFIDHRPGPRRQFDLLLYADRSDIVVLHDTEHASLYKYDQGLSVYPYKYRFTKLKTYTDVLSLKNETVIKTIRYLLESIPDYYFSNITLK